LSRSIRRGSEALTCRGFGVWRSLVARSVRVGEVPSSNLGTPIEAPLGGAAIKTRGLCPCIRLQRPVEALGVISRAPLGSWEPLGSPTPWSPQDSDFLPRHPRGALQRVYANRDDAAPRALRLEAQDVAV